MDETLTGLLGKRKDFRKTSGEDNFQFTPPLREKQKIQSFENSFSRKRKDISIVLPQVMLGKPNCLIIKTSPLRTEQRLGSGNNKILGKRSDFSTSFKKKKVNHFFFHVWDQNQKLLHLDKQALYRQDPLYFKTTENSQANLKPKSCCAGRNSWTVKMFF